jgi:formylmethanofuran dehydrogenase subunit C
VSDQIALALRAALDRALDLSPVAADRFAALGARDIAALPVRYGGLPAALGDFFTIKGERAARVQMEGDLARAEGIGTAMAGGELVIAGSVGRDVGLGLAGGTIDVHGNAGLNAGGAPPGAARGMTGGEIVIRGSAGDDVGALMRRGLIVVMGDGGRGMGRGMIAGTVLVLGSAGPGAARFSKRGSLVAFGQLARPATFRYACTYRPPHLRVLLCYLRTRYQLPFSDAHVAGRYHRYCGDLAEIGKGEILQWAEARSGAA